MADLTVSYMPQTMQTFIAHWTQVNANLDASPIVLKNGYNLASFTADRAALVSAMDAVIPAANTAQGAMATRDTQKLAAKTRLTQFRAAVAAFLPDTKYVRMLPTLPLISANETRFLAPFVDMSAIWNLVNTETNPGFTAPLVLPGNYTKAVFDADLAALKNAYLAVSNALVGASALRAARDMLLPPAKARMKQYRTAVVARLSVGSALLSNIPRYTVSQGPAAQAVNPAIVWNATTGKAVITWAASASADVSEYSVRTAPVPTYKTADESVVGNVGASMLTFVTDEGLTVPGTTALFKVYTVTQTGRERGSRALKVTRP